VSRLSGLTCGRRLLRTGRRGAPGRRCGPGAPRPRSSAPGTQAGSRSPDGSGRARPELLDPARRPAGTRACPSCGFRSAGHRRRPDRGTALETKRSSPRARHAGRRRAPSWHDTRSRSWRLDSGSPTLPERHHIARVVRRRSGGLGSPPEGPPFRSAALRSRPSTPSPDDFRLARSAWWRHPQVWRLSRAVSATSTGSRTRRPRRSTWCSTGFKRSGTAWPTGTSDTDAGPSTTTC
jgi:hypothetical protein